MKTECNLLQTLLTKQTLIPTCLPPPLNTSIPRYDYQVVSELAICNRHTLPFKRVLHSARSVRDRFPRGASCKFKMLTLSLVSGPEGRKQSAGRSRVLRMYILSF